MELAIPLAMRAGGSILAAKGSQQTGASSMASGRYAQQSAYQAANDAQGAASRNVADDNRKTQLLISRATAQAAASGGSVTDPSVSRQIGGIAKQGEYNQLVSLYNGESQAQKLRTQGDLALYEAEQKNKASKSDAMSSLLTGGATLFSKYAPKGLFDAAGGAAAGGGFFAEGEEAADLASMGLMFA